METSWQNITRRLDIEQVSRDTTFDKTKAKGRGLAKIPLKLNLPAITFTPSAIGIATANPSNRGFLIAQFNFTVPSVFRILDAFISVPSTVAANRVQVMLRYRDGLNVYRYACRTTITTSVNDSTQLNFFKTNAAFYAKQALQPNFTVEYYSRGMTSVNSSTTLAAVQLTTSLLNIPTDTDELYTTLDPEEVVLRGDIDEAFPEPLPTTYPTSSQWLDN